MIEHEGHGGGDRRSKKRRNKKTIRVIFVHTKTDRLVAMHIVVRAV